MTICDSCLNKESCQKGIQESLIFGKEEDVNSLPDIISAFLILTQGCNLKCKYCFVVQKPRSMTYEIAKEAADFLAKNAKKKNETPGINFFGGEPLLKWEDIIVPITLYIRSEYGKNYRLSMTTNGVLLDEKKLEFMKEHNIGFMVSIDGNRKTQDLNRPCSNGNSSFDIIAPKIPLFLKYNPNMTFRATVDHDNVEEYLNNHKFAAENGYTNMFSIVNVFTKWSEEEKRELENQIHMTVDYYMNLMFEGKSFSINPFESMFQKIEKVKKAESDNQFRTLGEGMLAHGRCGLGASKFASVGTDGTIYSCQEMSDNDELGKAFIIGDIYQGVDNAKRMEIISRFNPKDVHSTDDIDCSKCPMNRICDGACTINNYFANGDLNIVPSILCFYYQCLYKEAIRVQEFLLNLNKMIEISKKRGIINGR